MSNSLIFQGIKLLIFDFDGVFTDNYVYTSSDGKESVRCSRSDGIGILRVRDYGIHTYIISTEENHVVSVRAKKLNIACIQGVKDKGIVVKEVCKNLGISIHEVAFIGNDVNDIPALRIVGLPIGVADSHPDIFQYIKYKTLKSGGNGAVREICDLLMHYLLVIGVPKVG
jgi:YrbI family 3-deoxy-D-manno-octulosonate 8-phosphate phosphatase